MKIAQIEAFQDCEERKSGQEHMLAAARQLSQPVNGFFTMHEAADLGVEIDEAALAARHVAV
jgi:hypothetical protein